MVNDVFFKALLVLPLVVMMGCSANDKGGAPAAPVQVMSDRHMFTAGPEGGVDRIKLGSGIADLEALESKLQAYRQIIIDPVAVSYNAFHADSYDNTAHNQRDYLAQQLRVTMADALRKRYPVIQAAHAPQTLRLRMALTGISGVKGQAGHYKMQQASMEATLTDSITGQLIVAVIDTRDTSDLAMPENTWQRADDVFSWWAQRLRHTLDASRK